jgi:DNA-binding NarL/FixJ family response regulator
MTTTITARATARQRAIYHLGRALGERAQRIGLAATPEQLRHLADAALELVAPRVPADRPLLSGEAVELLQLLAAGESTLQIAALQHTTDRVIRDRVSRLVVRTGARSREHLIALAFKWRYLQVPNGRTGGEQ